ncbi:unnamed protein product [Victoria cruziana]
MGLETVFHCPIPSLARTLLWISDSGLAEPFRARFGLDPGTTSGSWSGFSRSLRKKPRPDSIRGSGASR